MRASRLQTGRPVAYKGTFDFMGTSLDRCVPTTLRKFREFQSIAKCEPL
jgi:hypothetical protein